MPELRQQFIDSTVENLELLREKILATDDFSDSFIKEIFRQIHTVKGTAQTFGLEKSSRIAHQLESILSDVKNGQNTLTKKLLLESITALKESFDKTNAGNTDDLIEKIKLAASAKKYSVKVLPELPENILNSLSKSETESLSAAFGNGKTIFGLEVYFALTGFREKLLDFREILEKHGEIIATLPASKKDLHIGFRFLYAGNIEFEKSNSSPKIIFEVSPINKDLLNVLEEITAHGAKLAEQLHKKVKFEISVADISISNNQIKIIFDALLHLIRNAIDHAIEIPAERIEKSKNETGKIEIRFVRENDDLKITVSDDGKGIDAEKIKLKAIEDKLISEDERLDEQKILDLIFLSGFSTAENLTDISGRGVGLDAVKHKIKSAGGMIKVKSSAKTGTIFEIVLPTES